MNSLKGDIVTGTSIHDEIHNMKFLVYEVGILREEFLLKIIEPWDFSFCLELIKPNHMLFELKQELGESLAILLRHASVLRASSWDNLFPSPT